MLLIGQTICPAATLTNDWINNFSGLWRDPANWSSNQAPDTNFTFIVITNASSKVVTIDALTPATNLMVTNLVLSAPSGSTNTLALVGLTTNLPLQIWRALTIDRGGDLTITNAAVALNGGAGVSFLDLAGGSALLESGSIQCNNAATRLGRVSGREGNLIVLGGRVAAGPVQLGAVPGSKGNLHLQGGVFDASSVFTVGYAASSTGIVSMSAGQFTATNDASYVGQSGFGQMDQSGGLSTFAFLTVGNNADGVLSLSGGVLTIQPRSTNDYFRVGNLGNGQVTISGGTNLVRAEFHIADSDFSVGTVLMTGGRLTATNDLVAIGRHGIGHLIISNATAQFTNTSVGRHNGSAGYVTLQTNGTLSLLDDLSIGRFSNSVGSVFIDGGLLSLPDDRIWVGREGTGELTISNGMVQAETVFVAVSSDPTNMPLGTLNLAGGALIVSSDFAVGTPLYSTGQVFVVGGYLAVTNSSGTGSLRIDNGTFNLNQGRVVVDQVSLTNSSGQLSVNSGTLEARNLTAANGLPFVVGDGIQPATLKLLGGTHTFADGLVISSNARVEGCGRIIGNINNSGTLATNCPATVSFTGISRTANAVTVSFTTVSNLTHFLEFKNSLNETGWTTLPAGILGDGGVMSKVDSTASVPSRFYRLRVQ